MIKIPEFGEVNSERVVRYRHSSLVTAPALTTGTLLGGQHSGPFFGEHEKVRGMRSPSEWFIFTLSQQTARILPDGLQHSEARYTSFDFLFLQKALVDERCHPFDGFDAQLLVRIANGFGALHRKGAGKHAQASEKLLLGRDRKSTR